MSQKRQVKKGKGYYRQHTVNALDEDWNLVKQEAERRGVSNSRWIMDLVKQHDKRHEPQTALKFFRNWFDFDEDKHDWGSEMWICEDFPSPYYYVGSRFHEEKIRRRLYTAGGRWERHVEESRRYHTALRKHITQPGFKSNEIYSTTALGELVDGRYCDIDREARIEAIDMIKTYLDTHCPDKVEVALLQDQIPTLAFRLHRTDTHDWGYIWAEVVYLDTKDKNVTGGLIREFDAVLSQCKFQQKVEVIDFLDGLIKKIKEQPKQ